MGDACTIALARRAGSSDLKIPEPTNTASAPSIMHSTALRASPPLQRRSSGPELAVLGQRTSSVGGALGGGNQLSGIEGAEAPYLAPHRA